MLKISNKFVIDIIQDMDIAISVMRSAGKWLEESGKNPSKWWKLRKKIIEIQLFIRKR